MDDNLNFNQNKKFHRKESPDIESHSVLEYLWSVEILLKAKVTVWSTR
jgi:hypothetical protein